MLWYWVAGFIASMTAGVFGITWLIARRDRRRLAAMLRRQIGRKYNTDGVRFSAYVPIAYGERGEEAVLN